LNNNDEIINNEFKKQLTHFNLFRHPEQKNLDVLTAKLRTMKKRIYFLFAIRPKGEHLIVQIQII